jgi:Amino acid permease
MLGAPGTGHGRVVDLFAVLLCLLIAVPFNLGIKTATRFETVVVAIKVAVVLLVIVVGFFYIKTSNYTPFFPFGVGGAITGAATVFFAVFGYDAMSTAAEESRDAQRHMPKAIIYSLAISMVLYVLTTLLLTGMQNYRDIDPESGFSSAVASVGLSGLATVIAARRHHRHPHGDVHLHARHHPGLVRHEPRRTAPAMVRQAARRAPRADPDHVDRRCRLRRHRRFPTDSPSVPSRLAAAWPSGWPRPPRWRPTCCTSLASSSTPCSRGNRCPHSTRRSTAARSGAECRAR